MENKETPKVQQLRIVGTNKEVKKVIERMMYIMQDGALLKDINLDEPYLRVDANKLNTLFDEIESNR